MLLLLLSSSETVIVELSSPVENAASLQEWPEEQNLLSGLLLLGWRRRNVAETYGHTDRGGERDREDEHWR